MIFSKITETTGRAVSSKLPSAAGGHFLRDGLRMEALFHQKQVWKPAIRQAGLTYRRLPSLLTGRRPVSDWRGILRKSFRFPRATGFSGTGGTPVLRRTGLRPVSEKRGRALNPNGVAQQRAGLVCAPRRPRLCAKDVTLSAVPAIAPGCAARRLVRSSYPVPSRPIPSAQPV
jgi:hypothetical protein